MEYLMTYGWALLVIVIVIAVLLSLNVFQAPEQCIFDQQNFACGNVRLIDTTKATASKGVLFADITNGNSKTITIDAITCIKGRTAPPSDWRAWTSGNSVSGITGGLTVPFQGTFNLGNPQNLASAANQLTCYDPATGAAAVISPNDQFNGRVYIAYKFADDANGVPDKIVGANVATKAQ